MSEQENVRVIMHLWEKRDFFLQEHTPEDVRGMGKALSDHLKRVAAIMELLKPFGFIFSSNKQHLYADARKIEAKNIRQILLSQGFQEYEFQVFFEQGKKWETL
jgi:hypothetical protein